MTSFDLSAAVASNLVLPPLAGRTDQSYRGRTVVGLKEHFDDPDWGYAPRRENDKTPAPDDAQALAAADAVRLETLSTDD